MEDFPQIYGKCLIRLKDEKKYLTIMTQDELGKLTTRDENSFYLILTTEKKKAVKWQFTKNEDDTISGNF